LTSRSTIASPSISYLSPIPSHIFYIWIKVVVPE